MAVIKTIILDVGNVIVRLNFERCHAALAEVCPYPAADIPRRMGSTGLVQRFESGKVSPEDFVREASGLLGMNVTAEQFWDIWSSIFVPETIIPEDLLESLCRQRQLLILSNTNAPHFALLRERYPLLRHFDGFILSYEVGALKPSPRIYREAIARAGCRPEECFFTDDVLANVEGARREGIDAVLFESLEQFERELRAREIQW